MGPNFKPNDYWNGPTWRSKLGFPDASIKTFAPSSVSCQCFNLLQFRGRLALILLVMLWFGLGYIIRFFLFLLGFVFCFCYWNFEENKRRQSVLILRTEMQSATQPYWLPILNEHLCLQLSLYLVRLLHSKVRTSKQTTFEHCSDQCCFFFFFKFFFSFWHY